MEHQDLRFQSYLEIAYLDSYREFYSCIRFYGMFHVGFISFLCMQLLAFLLFFSYFSQSLIAACGLAVFFLTFFSYFVLLFFFQAKKPEQLLAIESRLFQTCQALIPQSAETSESSIVLCQALDGFVHFLHQQEILFYSSDSRIQALVPLIQKFTIWMHWKNFHQMKELVLQKSAEVLIEQIKRMPTDPSIHASLAETYTKLAKLYLPPHTVHPALSLPWESPEYANSFMKERFSLYAEKTIEECKILESLTEKDPWVLARLAEIYRLQEKAAEEILQCEQLLQLTPENPELLFQLGVLYFKEGHAAKGLKIYELLQKDSSSKASALIEYYR